MVLKLMSMTFPILSVADVVETGHISLAQMHHVNLNAVRLVAHITERGR